MNEQPKAAGPMAENSTVDVALAEFTALRNEIAGRAGWAWTLFNLNMTASAAIAGFVLSDKADPLLLLLIPLISSCLGMLFIDHSLNIRNIGHYIDSEVRPIIIQKTDNDKLLAYEHFVGRHEQEKFLRFIPLAIPVCSWFAILPSASIIYLLKVVNTGLAWSLWAIGLLSVLVFVGLWLSFVLSPFSASTSTRAMGQLDGRK